MVEKVHVADLEGLARMTSPHVGAEPCDDDGVGRTEKYVVGLLETLLGPSDRVRRFAWACGDVSPKTGRKAMLPFDAVWEARRLIVEVDEEQHTQATAFFDKPHRMTVSGVHRGRQRALYDEQAPGGARPGLPARRDSVATAPAAASRRRCGRPPRPAWKRRA
jgi:hypothetical protein